MSVNSMFTILETIEYVAYESPRLIDHTYLCKDRKYSNICLDAEFIFGGCFYLLLLDLRGKNKSRL